MWPGCLLAYHFDQSHVNILTAAGLPDAAIAAGIVDDLNAAGFKVWPAEVEALMFRHPAIQEACVIATKDAYRGESVKAVVVLRASHQGQVSEQDIIDWCRDNMAVYKVPRVIQFADALPKSGSGKVMWRLLQEAEGG